MKLFKRPKDGEGYVNKKFAYLPTKVTCQKTGDRSVIWLEDYTQVKVWYDNNITGGFWDKKNFINYRPWEERWEEAKKKSELDELYKKGY